MYIMLNYRLTSVASTQLKYGSYVLELFLLTTVLLALISFHIGLRYQLKECCGTLKQLSRSMKEKRASRKNSQFVSGRSLFYECILLCTSYINF